MTICKQCAERCRVSGFCIPCKLHRPQALLVIASIALLLYGLLDWRWDVLSFSLRPDFPKHQSWEDRSVFSATAVPPSAKVAFNATWNNISLPILTCHPLGRLGNVMGEYATIYALKYVYNASVVLMPKMRRILGGIFPNLSLPDMPGEYQHRHWRSLKNVDTLYNYTLIEVAAAGLLGPHRFVITEYPFEIQLFNAFKKDLRKEFTFSRSLMTKVGDFFHNVTRTWQKNNTMVPIFVGFHIRRTDYAKHAKNKFGAQLPDERYFQRALNYFRHKYPNVVFVVASDDQLFLRENFKRHKDVFFAPGVPPALDLAVLASCNHSIITMGSFGFWAGYLTGGEVVYPIVETRRIYRFSHQTYQKVGLRSFTPLPVS